MSDMGLGTKVVAVNTGTTANAAAADLDGSPDARLLTYTASKPCTVVAYGAIAVTGGILTAGSLKLRKNTLAVPGTFADIAGSVSGPGIVRAIGEGFRKRVGAPPVDPLITGSNGHSPYTLRAGESVAIAIGVAAGGTSTAHVFIEVVEHGFAGDLVEHVEEV